MSGGADVEVLLATYNGEPFLRDQIESILGQDYAGVRVVARDDGSSDGTVEILEEFAERFPERFQVLPPSNGRGSAKDNFLQLMIASRERYVCLADQDDVWQPQKISLSKSAMDRLESMSGGDTPLLVFTDLCVVDDELNVLRESFWKHQKLDPARIHNFAALLGQNVVTGCTVMMNRRLVDLALRMPSEAYMHDQWVALLAAAMGSAMPVEIATVLYRQHDRNVVGFAQRGATPSDLVRRFRNHDARRNQWKTSQRQAEAFLRTYEVELPADIREVLRSYLKCGATESRLMRSYLLIRYGFLRAGFLEKMATLIDI